MGPVFMVQAQAGSPLPFCLSKSMGHAMDVDSSGFSQPSLPPSHFMTLSAPSDVHDLLPCPRIELPHTGNGHAQGTISPTEYTASSSGTSQPFQPPSYSMASISDVDRVPRPPASNANPIVQDTRARPNASGYGHPEEYAVVFTKDASQQGAIEHPPNRQARGPTRPSKTSRLHRPRRTQGNPYPQLPSLPPSEGTRPVPVPFIHIPLPEFNACGNSNQIQQAAPTKSQPTTVTPGSSHQGHHCPSGQSLGKGKQEDLSRTHYRSDLRQGEIEHQILKCHRLLATGQQTSSQQEVVERNQFLAGHHGGR
ncbi:hypothetical protein CPB84DRAFT_1803201 [Gymnopilus junonius]|uniref:Uncharacterized protein n=1 Tax=Gymnopilus junonius TaxID=109634 RepID=A0A9P5TEK3_GYMJU|nr:hypothetical protein CPB84DRAFT_1803201 [Gymnopilus junonius]